MTPVRPFSEWKTLLLHDAELHPNRSEAAATLGDHVLVLFWSDGCDPTVEALLHHARTHKKPSHPAPPVSFPQRRFDEST